MPTVLSKFAKTALVAEMCQALNPRENRNKMMNAFMDETLNAEQEHAPETDAGHHATDGVDHASRAASASLVEKQEVKRQSAQLEISFGDSTIFSFPEVISERSLGKFAASLREFIIHDANENLLKPLVANLCVRLMKEARFAADKNDEQLADMKSQDHFTFSNDGRRECHIFDFAFIVRRFIHDDNKGNNLWQYGRLKAEESLFSKILSGDGHRVQACRKRLEDRMTEYDKSR
ncbi:unnamed protein product [Amoebophrya sp. A25]|nr:unnamed protein product [Amoebophrya sp. A25]|eukprot:GSA25T00014047001.1